MSRLTLDTDDCVFFYEQDHYYLSNFSAFKVRYNGRIYYTSETAYQAQKFINRPGNAEDAFRLIVGSLSAHAAFKIAQQYREYQRPDWDDVKVGIMEKILIRKAQQHPYVLRKLLSTGKKKLIENSWRDDFWGWGENRDGLNMLGKLWEKIRDNW